MRAQDALRMAVAQLTQAGIPDASRDARHLLAYAMQVRPDRVTLHLHDDLTDDQTARITAAMTARAQHQPVSQITGARLFWGRSFRVTPDVLDPRPETEALIAECLLHPFERVLDLGTGSGAILITLLAERPLATGVAVDLSPAALAVARSNAAALAVADRATFLASDWFGAVRGEFDLIVSNPPYISADEMAGLSPDVLNWEPHLALTPGGDGLAAYRAIAAGVMPHLAPKGRLIVEIGPTQGAAVSALFIAAGLVNTTTLHDMDNRPRVIVATRH